MKPKAVILDIYRTVLDVGLAPEDAERQWSVLWGERFGGGAVPRLSLAEFRMAAESVVASEHAVARAVGITYPEVVWMEVMRTVLPEMARLDAAGQADLAFRHAGLGHSVRLMPGSATVLRSLRHHNLQLGIASNAQPYTLRELDEAFAGTDLERAWFDPALCFWSFEHGFSKPDPHVFRLLTARLRGRGVAPDETLMVGDRADNDIEPARAQGWQTWRMGDGDGRSGGGWGQLASFLGLR